MQKLTINRVALEEVFEQFSQGEMTAYLDTVDGSILWLENDTLHRIEELLSNADTLEEVEDAIREDAEFADHQAEQLIEFARAEWGENNRYRAIPHRNSDLGYRDMQAYIHSLEDERLRDVLSVAISGAGAFRRFKEVIQRNPKVRDAWYIFHDARVGERILAWLHSEGLEAEFR
jgi:hypothetical protein